MLPPFFFQLEFLPVLEDFVGRADGSVAEHVRMAIDQFGVQGIADVGDVKRAFFLSDLGVEKYMEQDVAEFLADVGVVFVYKGVAKLIDFLYGVRTQRFVGLFGIPGTFYTQNVERVDDASQCLDFFLAGV